MHPATRVSKAKLRPPRDRENQTYPRRLIRQLDEAQTKVILVVAPAGFGKTTLLSRWVRDIGKAGAWLSLGPENDSLPSFLRHVVAAMTPICSGLSGMIDNALSDSAAEMVIGEIEDCVVPWVLIIDDYHVISTPAIHTFVDNLINVMPDNSRLVISSRTEPPLPIARLRVRENLTLLTAGDLRATPKECRATLNQFGIDVSELEALAIAERTAGWMVAVHLLAMASQSKPVDQVIQSLRAFEDELDLLSQYLLQEVLGHVPPVLREFLLQISILDRFTVETCYAVTEDVASGQLLEQARRNGLFLIELDDARTWFRFHDLFRQFLLHELALESDPQATHQLHFRASQWYRQHHFDDEAVAHAVKAEDWPTATALITSIAIQLFLTHRLAELVSWLETFPTGVILADPDLSSITAWTLTRIGRGSEAASFVESAERIWQQHADDTGIAVTEMIRGTIARFREDGGAMIEHGARSIALATGDQSLVGKESFDDLEPHFLRYTGTWLEPLPMMIPHLQIALGLIYQGRVSDSEPIAEKIVTAFEKAGFTSYMTAALTVLALARVASARLTEAEAILLPITRIDLRDLPTERATSIAALAEIYYEWNRLDECDELLQNGILMLARADTQAHDSPLQLQLARLRWRLGDEDGGYAALACAAESAGNLQNLRRMNEVEALRARIAIAGGDFGQANRWALTMGFLHEPVRDHTRVYEYLVLARLLIATDDADGAAILLEELREAADRDGRLHDLIHILVLQSIAYLDLFELDRAVEVLRDALEIGGASGYVRIFLDEGAPMIRLLRIVHRRGVQVQLVEVLLETAGEAVGQLVRLAHPDLVEPLTTREIEVLRSVALGLTNREIADEFYLALPTIKRHITNINGKLGVSGRTEAVQTARRLNLLPTEHKQSGVSPKTNIK